MEQLQETLLDIEADTYAELIRNGKLSKNLSPLLLEILSEAEEV
jgi:CPA1 family monovalent cation:H+ antiporter